MKNGRVGGWALQAPGGISYLGSVPFLSIPEQVPICSGLFGSVVAWPFFSPCVFFWGVFCTFPLRALFAAGYGTRESRSRVQCVFAFYYVRYAWNWFCLIVASRQFYGDVVLSFISERGSWC